MSGTTRAQFLSRGAKGGVALVAGGSVLALAQGTAFGAASTDADIAKLAATAELLAIDFYTRAIASKKLKGDELGYLAVRDEQRARPLRRAQGRAEVGDPRRAEVQVPGRSIRLAEEHRQLGQALETAFVGAYMGAVTALKSNELKGVAAEIGACESRHLSVLSNIAADQIAPAPDLPKVLTAKQATAAVTPFLA